MTKGAAPTNKPSICIAVCTAGRPKMLKACLASLVSQETKGEFTFDILVVDNNPEPQVKPGILKTPDGAHLHIVHEPERGIPYARNAALAFLNHHDHDYLAFIDDDERAAPDWLRHHLHTLKTFKADASGGPVSFVYDAERPSWYPEEEEDTRPEGTPTGGGASNNIIFSREVSSPEGYNLMFDTQFIIGGEDVEFFRRLYLAGGHIVWSPKAQVTETVPAERLTMEYILKRKRNLATQYVQMLTKRKGRVKSTLRYSLRILRLLPLIAFWYIFGLSLLFLTKQNYSSGSFRYRLLASQISGYWRGIMHTSLPSFRPIQGY